MEVEVGWRMTTIEDNGDNVSNEQEHNELSAIFRWDVGPGLEFDVEYATAGYMQLEGVEAPVSRRGHAIRVKTKVSF